MATKNTEIHALTTAESAQAMVLADRDRQITNELADRYKNALKNGGTTPIIDADEQAGAGACTIFAQWLCARLAVAGARAQP